MQLLIKAKNLKGRKVVKTEVKKVVKEEPKVEEKRRS